ncbi:MAG: hypothetical protein EA379_03515 [Phycisphaerales bacterium]|nr:MAG: hypothetical protein EA379_03515 [Phycisphaerales bacterium]
MPRFTRLAIIACAAFSFAAHAQLHSGDIILHTDEGRILTGIGNPGAGTFEERQIFTAILGTSFPNFTSDPGFDCLPGTFPVPSANGFNVLDALWHWDGETFVPTAGENMRISLGPANVTTSDGFVAGFTLNVASNGSWHRHYSFFLQQGAAPAIADGVYLLQLEIYNTGGALEPTEPIYMLFNQNASASDVDDAAAWVQANFIDEPGIPGDLNGDGVVDFADLSIVLSQFGMEGDDLDGDANGDGVVDFTDLSIVLSNFGTGL